MNIRFQGFSCEVAQVVQILENCPGISIVRESKDYTDRNSKYVRRYIDIDLKKEDPHHD